MTSDGIRGDPVAAHPACVTAANRVRRGGSSENAPRSPHGQHNVRVRQPAQVEVELLQADGRPVVPAPPVEDTFGAPGIEDPQPPHGSQGAQTPDRASVDDAGPRQDEDVVRSGKLRQQGRLGLRPLVVARRECHSTVADPGARFDVELHAQTVPCQGLGERRSEGTQLVGLADHPPTLRE